MDINKYKQDDWIVYFSGDKWSPLGFSSWVSLYTQRPFSPEVDFFVNQAVMVWDGVTTTCYIRESERKRFGKKVVRNVMNDSAYVDFICKKFRASTDFVLSIYNKKKKSFTHKEYADYNAYFLNNYYPYHIQIKNVVDFLPKKILDLYLPKLQAVRVHAEPVFSQETGYMRRVAKYLSKKSGYKVEHILQCLVSEVTAYWKNGKFLPDKNVLKERARGCVIFFGMGGIQGILSGGEVSKLASIFLADDKSGPLKGQTAFAGKVRGIVRVIFDPAVVKEFNRGDILVAPWTRPEYLPIMEKAGAFVTDGGGILSHAAITARELKKPCVIGTKIATRVFKDGDLVEVDATNGIVKKLS